MPNSLSITFNEGDIESIQADGKLIPTATSRGSTDEQAAATRESTGLVDDNTNDEEQPAAVKAKEKSKGMSGRPINATDISVEDQIIIRMKRERRSDKEIADHLRTECNCHYVPKTIGTRWARLRAKIAVLKDKQLETGEVNWTTKEVSSFTFLHSFSPSFIYFFLSKYLLYILGFYFDFSSHQGQVCHGQARRGDRG